MFLKFLKTSLFLLTISFYFSGCDSVKSAVGIKQSKVWLEKINFKAEKNANDSSVTRVHVVIPYNDVLAAQLLKLDGQSYFQKESDLKDSAGADLDVFKIDVIPDSTATLEITPSNSNGVTALLFARYESKGEHRYNVSADYEIDVDLKKHKLVITPIKKG